MITAEYSPPPPPADYGTIAADLPQATIRLHCPATRMSVNGATSKRRQRDAKPQWCTTNVMKVTSPRRSFIPALYCPE